MLCFETKNLQRLMDYTVMSLTNPHTIRGRSTLKDVERFRNGSFHEFCRLKALITLKEVNTSDVETRKNVHEQNFDDEVKNNKQIVVNLPLVFNSLILFLFFMMLDTCNEQLDISYIINIIVQVMINVVLFYAWSSTLQHTENCLQNCNVLEKGNNFAHVREHNDMPVSIKVEKVRSRLFKQSETLKMQWFFLFRRWDLVCRPCVPSEDRGNWG